MTEQVRLIQASAHDIPIADKSVHTICTSPPYFAKRMYAGEQAVEWPAITYRPDPLHDFTVTVPAMRCALGLEPDLSAYLGHLVLCLREWWRILRDDGTAWVVIGDSFSSNASNQNGTGKTTMTSPDTGANLLGRYNKNTGLPAKNLLLVPSRFALAAQADGWIVRSEIPWLKKNSLPESQQDRPTTGHEYVYLLAKQSTYYYDQEAVRMPTKPLTAAAGGWQGRAMRKQKFGATFVHENHTDIQDRVYEPNPAGRIRRTTDWWFDSLDAQIAHLQHVREHGGALVDEDGIAALQVNTKGYSAAHFACFPDTLVDPIVRCATSDYGVCSKCGAPWQRVVEREAYTNRPNSRPINQSRGIHPSLNASLAGPQNGGRYTKSATTGWQPTCTCGTDEVEQATVLDPFSGSGTTGLVAVRNRRNYIGVDVSAEYLTEHDRISGTQIRLF